jgi:hypothetical protein
MFKPKATVYYINQQELTVTENNQTTHNCHTTSRKSTGDAQPQQRQLNGVLLTLSARLSKDASTVRELFPDAQESALFVERPLEASDRRVELCSVFRQYYPTIELAHEACQRLPPSVSYDLTAATVLEEDEFEVLAQYHASKFFCAMTFAPASPERKCGGYHDRRLRELGSVLGQERMRAMYMQIESVLDAVFDGREPSLSREACSERTKVAAPDTFPKPAGDL